MAKKNWKLIDAKDNHHADGWQATKNDVANAPDDFHVRMRTLRCGLSQSVDVIEINNGSFRFTVLPSRGMGVWKGWLGDLPIGWDSPVHGPVHPSHVQLTEPSGLGWLDGFDELLCRCGMVSNGAPEFAENGSLVYPLHGRVANRPAHFVEVEIDGDEISIKGIVEESRFHFTKLRLYSTLRTKFGEKGFRIHDEVENYSASESEMQMLYHINFGAPLLEAGAELVVPVDEIVPRNEWAAQGIGHWSTYSEPTAGMEERVYFYSLLGDNQGHSQALLKNAKANRGVSLDFNTKQLSCFTLWKNETALNDGYVTGLEPGTNFPNPRSFEGEQGRVVTIKPGAMYAMDVGLTVHDNGESIAEVEKQIESLQAKKPPTIHEKPQPNWCA